MNALLYVRCANPDKAAEQSQLNQLRTFAHQKGYDIAGEIVESGVKGLTLERPGIRQMIDMVSKKGVDLVLAVNHSRIARSFKDYLALERTLREQGVLIMTLCDSPG